MGLKSQSKGRTDTDAYKRAARAAMIVPVKRFRAHSAVHVADLTGLDALVDLAEAYEAMLLEVSTKRATTYLVPTGNVLYRYVIAAHAAKPGDAEPTKSALSSAESPRVGVVSPDTNGGAPREPTLQSLRRSPSADASPAANDSPTAKRS